MIRTSAFLGLAGSLLFLGHAVKRSSWNQTHKAWPDVFQTKALILGFLVMQISCHSKQSTKDPREGLVSQSCWRRLWASGWRFLCRTQAGSCFYVLPSSFAERVKSVSQRRLPSVVCTAASPQLRQSTQLFVVPAFPFLKGGGWLVETWNEVTLRSAGPLEGLSAMVTMGTAQGTQITLQCNSWVWARDLMYRLIWPWTLFCCCCCN